MPKIRSQYDNCRVWLRNNYQKKNIDYESKTDYLFKHDNCAWIYSEYAGIIMLGKYEYPDNCAWNIL